MRQFRVSRAAIVLVPLAVLAQPALADSFDLMSSDGPMRIRISPDGDVRGDYPKLQGTMWGHVGPDGELHGLWAQPRSDHPCREARANTYAWGSFTISSPYHHHMRGYWGYCGEEPNRDWSIEHD